MRRLLLVSLVAFCALFALGGVASAESVIETIKHSYASIIDLQGGFRQESVIKELGETKTASGRFYIKKGKMRWEYAEPEKQTIVVSGGEMLVKQAGNPEIMRGKFDASAYGQTPIALLSGLGDVERDFLVKQEGASAIILTPKADMGVVRTIKIEAGRGAFPVKTLKLTDIYGNTNLFTLEGVKINKGIGDEVFVP